MDKTQWDVLEGQIEGVARAVAALAAELHEAGLIGVGDYAQRALAEAGRLGGGAQCEKAREVMEKIARFSQAISG